MFGCLLERHTDYDATIAQLRRPVAEEEVGKILNRRLAFEGHSATARGVRAHPRRRRIVAEDDSYLL